MSFGIFLVILASALLHASWNLISKKSLPSTAFFTLMSTSNAIIWSWTLFFIEVDWSALGKFFILIWLSSIFFECLYFTGIANAYKKLDISMGYPMIRALPVLLIAVLSFALPPHKLPSFIGGIGLILVASGCLLMPLKKFGDFKLSNYTGKALKYILIGAIGTTGYTMFDALALGKLTSATMGPWGACLYVFMIESGIAISLGTYTLIRQQGRNEMAQILKTATFWPSAAGLASSIAYSMILYAMPRVTQLSYLQAFRQMSLPFGVLLGMIVLKEKVSIVRWSGVLLILFGLILIAVQ